MRNFELYQAILGLQAPWRVINVELNVPRQQATVTVDAGPGHYPCPECQERVPGYDRKRRRGRHVDTCQFATWIQPEVPQVNCPPHGVRQITVPWAEPGSQSTAWFERLAIDLLRKCSVTGPRDSCALVGMRPGGSKRAGHRPRTEAASMASGRR